jgi:hypothetical protein
MIVGLVLFSLFGAFEYVVVARNYGMSALVMFALAALYGRVKGTPWFGLALAILCNTNVPSCIIAAALLLIRFLEMIDDKATRGEWLMFGVNAAIAASGAVMCFATLYPTPNNGAVSSNFQSFGPAAPLRALFDWRSGFSSLTLNGGGPAGAILLLLSCLIFVRKRSALAAALAAFFALKLFFYIIYPSSYRHEALFVVFLLSLLWIEQRGSGAQANERMWMGRAQSIGAISFTVLLTFQSLDLAKPLYLNASGVPYSRSAAVGELLRDRGLSQAVVMGDPDTMLEALPYYASNPLWFLRTHSFGRVAPLSRSGRRELSLDDVLADADRLHRSSRRPVVFLSHLELQDLRPERRLMMYDLATSTTPESVRRFRQGTRLIARLRPAVTDEAYDVYVYPR